MQLDGQLAGNAEFTEVAKKFVLVKADLSSRSQDNPFQVVARQFGVSGIPDIRIVDSDGKEISSPNATPAAMVAAMKKAVQK